MSDFSGMATVYNLLCQDGRTIEEGSFDHQDGQQVPLVFKHNHSDITSFLGYAILRKSDNPKGMRVEATFNNTKEGQHALELVKTGVIKHLSIWANNLVEEVVHGAEEVAGVVRRMVKKGTIREVSLVLAGANPGAVIDDVVRHADDPFDPEFIVMDGVIIHTDTEITVGEDEEPEEPEELEDDDEDIEDPEDDEDGFEVRYIDDLTDEDIDDLTDEETALAYIFLDSLEEVDGQIDHISHYGVKGMRWGVRKDRSSGTGGSKKYRIGDSGVKEAIKELTIGGEYQRRNRANLKARVEARARDFIAGRQERASRKIKKDADSFRKAADDLEKGISSGTGRSGKKITSLRQEAKRMKSAADQLDEMAALESDSRRKKSLETQAKALRDGSKGLEHNANSKTRNVKKEISMFREIADALYADSSRFAKAAVSNRKKAEEARKRAEANATHGYGSVSEDIIHQTIADDATITDILKTLTDEQEQLFNMVMHSAVTGETIPPDTQSDDDEDGPTVQEVFDSLSEEQKETLNYLAGVLAEKTLSQEGDESIMKTTHNIFEGNAGSNKAIKEFKEKAATLLHSARSARATSLRDVFAASDIEELAHDGDFLSHAPAATITNIDYLFPDARPVQPGGPMFYSRRMEWVDNVLGDIRPRPFARIKSWYADVTADEARALGYVTGDLKVDEVIEVLKRVTTPQTIYKRQKLDRDDMLDITDFDVVVWLKSEMRMMLREELARAILISDGRSGASDYKIVETNIRPVFNDSDVYTVKAYFNDVGSLEALATMDFAETLAVMDHIAAAMTDYRGSGGPTFFCSPEVASKFLLLRNSDGVRIHKTMSEVAEALRVSKVVEVPVMSGHSQADVVDPSGIPSGTYDIETIGVIVNLADYVIGQDRGGETTFFDDFDIDYNQYKYLYETRLSGALVIPKSAVFVGNVTAKTA